MISQVCMIVDYPEDKCSTSVMFCDLPVLVNCDFGGLHRLQNQVVDTALFGCHI